MSISTQIQHIRMEKNITQEEFGKLFHVTRQTVSNWENEKSYPDLQTLVAISDTFDVSLDVLLKDDNKMMKAMDEERLLGIFTKEQKEIATFFGEIMGYAIDCIRMVSIACWDIFTLPVKFCKDDEVKAFFRDVNRGMKESLKELICAGNEIAEAPAKGLIKVKCMIAQRMKRKSNSEIW